MTKIEPIVIDRNTGALIDGVIIQTEAQRIAYREYIKRLEARDKLNGGESFIFNVMANVKHVSSVLTAAQCGYLLVLSTYIDYDGRLMHSRENAESLNNADIMRLLNIKERSFYDFIGACKDYGFISQHDDGIYYVCSDINFRGSPQDNRVVRSYITTLREMATTNKPEHVGILYKLFPHISKYTNMLVMNPEEKVRTRRVKLKRVDIANVAGVTPQYITRLTSTMIWRNKSVFAQVKTATDGRFYMLNPAIFRRADDVNYDDTTRDIFGI